MDRGQAAAPVVIAGRFLPLGPKPLAVLLLALPLAGCLAPEEALPRARAGDFVLVDLAAWDAGGREVENASALRAVMAPALPAGLPEGWDVNSTRALPPGVIEAMDGQRPGAEVDTGPLPPERAYGNWSEARAIRVPRVEALPRVLAVHASEVRNGTLRWAGHPWSVEVLEPNGSEARVRLLEGPAEGALLEIPDYWNERYGLWRSRLLGYEEQALRVEHLATLGHEALVGGVRYRVTQAGEEVVADGNHPLAGQSLRFRVRLREIVFEGQGSNPQAPDALLVTVEGQRLHVSDLRGKAALLDFFATWCLTCKRQAPILARAHAEFGDRLEIVSVTIDPLDTPERVRAFQAEAERASLVQWGRALPANWTFAFDPTGEASRSFGVAVIPREVLLDAQGRIRATSVGLHPWPDLVRDVQAALASA